MKAVYLEEGAVNPGDITLEPITSLIDTKVYKNTTEEDKYEHIGDAEVVFSNKVIFDEETFERCPNLKYIGVCATGYNVIDVEAAKRHGVTVTNVPAYSTESVVQLAWGFILECACHISLHNESVSKGDWIKSETFCYWLKPVMELAEKTIGIIGFGNIGKRMAEVANAFNMKTICYTAHPEKYASYNNIVEFVSMDELWTRADIVSLHCPMTKETEKMINKYNISKMKDNVIIINVSRGGLVNEKDLADALASGKVSAAAADVVSMEPMEADNPLFKAPNMVLTPHMAWASVEARKRLIDIVASNFKAYTEGRSENVVE
ncbi:MAG: D-2-hydroxyacid dehydrogenase [Eubacterium sp.]|nr:D-2-hydroxyacid dehydrogenase [Eubacterium sp.]